MNTASIAIQDISKEYNKFNLKNPVSDILTVGVKDKIHTDKKVSQSTSLEREVALEISKTLLASFSSEMVEICESYHCTKLTTQFKGLSKFAEGRVGTRPICLSKYGKKLTGFEFNYDVPYNKALNAKYHIKQGSRRDQVIIHFPAFVPDKDLERSKEATNFKINTCLVALSDFRYDNVDECYKPLNHDLHGKYSVHSSSMLPILKMPTDPMTSQLCLDQTSMIENTALLLIMSVNFFTYDHGRFVHLKKDGCMQIKQVF
ncbi:MAG: hypothetical protein GY816_06150 [Cytophagales bacterium]|nr:hypothetical protein [Cytophagales bacterium]